MRDAAGHDGPRQQSFFADLADKQSAQRGRLRTALAVLDLPQRIRDELEKLVFYLDYCADSEGSKARQDTLRKRLRLSQRTLQRRLAVLRDAGLVAHRRRQGGAVNRVDWDAIGRLARGDLRATSESGICHVARGTCQSGTCSKQGCSSSLVEELIPPPPKSTPVLKHPPEAVVVAGEIFGAAAVPTERRPTRTPSPRPGDQAGLDRSGSSPVAAAWGDALAALAACGLASAASIAEAARARGVSPADVLACAAVFRREPGRWDGAGALGWRVKQLQAGAGPPEVQRTAGAVEDLATWPPPSAAYVARERRQQARDRPCRALADVARWKADLAAEAAAGGGESRAESRVPE